MNKFFDITKEELWLLQTKLQTKDIRNITTYIYENRSTSNLKFSEILKNCSINNKYNLLNFSKDLNMQDLSRSNRYIDRFKLEFILQKKLKHPLLTRFSISRKSKYFGKTNHCHYRFKKTHLLWQTTNSSFYKKTRPSRLHNLVWWSNWN